MCSLFLTPDALLLLVTSFAPCCLFLITSSNPPIIFYCFGFYLSCFVVFYFWSSSVNASFSTDNLLFSPLHLTDVITIPLLRKIFLQSVEVGNAYRLKRTTFFHLFFYLFIFFTVVVQRITVFFGIKESLSAHKTPKINSKNISWIL